VGDGTGQTIAIIDAYNDPTIFNDLHTFDQTFGLPDPPNFAVVREHKGSKLPKDNKGWSQEIALDVEWAHAIAPGANIALIEALNPSELDSAINYARNLSIVSVISMSLAGNEYKQEALADSLFTTPGGHVGETFVAASGDSGAKPQYPSGSPNVLSVGGSTLNVGWNGDWYRGAESVWSGGGGGQSQFEGMPSFQNGLGLTSRGTPDVSYDGDPRTGFAVYDSFGSGGWAQIGGTSAGAPQWAALIAIANQGRALNGKAPLANAQAALYSLPSTDFFDVTAGSNGKGSFAHVGYDVASGLGSPIANLLIPDLANYAGSTDFSVAAIPKPVKSGKGSKSTKAKAIENELDGGESTVATGGIMRSESLASAWAGYEARTVSSRAAAGGRDLLPLSPRVADEAFSASDLRTAVRRLGKRTAGAFASADDSSISGIDGYFASVSRGKVVAALE
jgi:subtilase family serine protease